MKKLNCIILLNFLVLGISKAQEYVAPKIADRNPARATVQLKNDPAVLSEYYGYDNQIKKICVDDNIPSGLPKKEGYTEKTMYKKAINDWLRAHNVYVKPEFQNTLIQD